MDAGAVGFQFSGLITILSYARGDGTVIERDLLTESLDNITTESGSNIQVT